MKGYNLQLSGRWNDFVIPNIHQKDTELESDGQVLRSYNR